MGLRLFCEIVSSHSIFLLLELLPAFVPPIVGTHEKFKPSLRDFSFPLKKLEWLPPTTHRNYPDMIFEANYPHFIISMLVLGVSLVVSFGVKIIF